jgi:hypothetical protein
LPQRLDLTAPISGLQAAIDPKMPQLVKDWMATSAGQKSHLYNGAYYFTESDRKRATEADKKQFMPRLGMSLRLDDKSALRVGYGRYYTPASAADGGNEPLGSMNLGAFSPTTNVTPLEDGRPLYSLSNPFPQGLTEAYGKTYGTRTNLGDSITISQYLRRLPLSDRINVSLQREVWNRTVLDVTYFKNWVSRDSLTLNLNMADPRLGFTQKAEYSRSVPNPFYLYGTEADMPGALRKQANISRANLLRPYPQYGDINQTFTDLGTYRNQSVTVRAQRPFANGYSYMVSYAHVTANSQVFYDDQDQYDRLLTRRPDTIPGHRVVAVGAWGIPIGRNQAFGSGMPRALDYVVGGWQISGIYRYRSGDLLNFGAMIAPDSVNVLGNTGAGAKWFDATGFSQLPAFTRRANPMYYSNLRGPTFHNLDAVISKTFAIHERVRPEFRLEAYNALNQMVWASPNMTVTSSAFGETNAHATGNAGRVLRYALRLEF